jgi:hypothetical protein
MGLAQRLAALEQAQDAPGGCPAGSGSPRITMAPDEVPTESSLRPCGTCGRPVRVVPFTLDLAHPRDDWRPADAL